MKNSNKADMPPAQTEKPVMRTNGILRAVFRADQLRQIVLTANYPITAAFVSVTDKHGAILYEDEYAFPEDCYEAPLKTILKLEALRPFENGENTLEIRFRLKNGTVLSGWQAFRGTLCPGNTATALEEEDFGLEEKLRAIPIANAQMSPEQLRQICVDFMRLQLSFPYKINRDLDYWVERQDHMVHWKKEELHAGVPYVNVGSGSLYRWLEYYDPKTGIVDLSEFGENKRLFGNACSGGCAIAWARCITSMVPSWTHQMTQARGVIPLGPYSYRKDIQSFKNPEKYTAKTVCLENGEQRMYESYALTAPGDGLNNPGHICMATGYPTVVRHADGTIDGQKSYAICSDQVMVACSRHHVRQQKRGDWYVVQGGVDAQIPFRTLYDGGYLPFTFSEFLGKWKVPKAQALPCVQKLPCNIQRLKDVEVYFPYPISDVFTTITDDSGRVVYKHIHRNLSFSQKNMQPAQFLPLEELENVRGSRIQMVCQLYNGEKLVAMDAPWIE